MNARHANYLRYALLAATTLVVAACGNGDDAPESTPAPQNTAPAVAAIADRSADQDTAVAVDIGIADAQTTDASLLSVVAVADGATLFPADGVVLSGTGATRTLTLTPLEAQTGVATITITATDPQGLIAARTFKVTVNAKTASGLATVQATVQKGERDTPTSLNGFTYSQDVGDQLSALLPPPEPVAGIE